MNKRETMLGGYLAAAGTVAIWSGFILISRLAGRSPLTPYDVLALRLGTAALLLAPFCRDIAAAQWRDLRLWVLAILGGLLYGVCVYAGFKQAPAAHGAILLPGIQPFLVAACAWLLGGTEMAPERRLGLIGIALGIGCVAWPVFSGHTAWSVEMLIGDALILVSSLAWAWFTVLARRWGYAPWLLTRFIALASALLFLPIYLLFLPKALDQVGPGMLVLQGLYQGPGPTIVAMLLFLRAVHSIGAERTGAMVALVPVLAGVAAAPVLGEELSGWLLLGLVLVSAGAIQAVRPLRTLRSATCPT
jgi:drug/metabolite transporter (DMT)-like permease